MMTEIIQSDEDLMQHYLDGSEEAFEELVSRYEKPILNFAYAYLRNTSASEDLVQDIFVKLVESRKQYNPERPFKPWIYQVARNRIYDELRKKKRWSLKWFQPASNTDLTRTIESHPGDSTTSRDTVNRSEIFKVVQEGIATLDDRCRDLIVLRFLHGISTHDVAEILHIPEGTVHSGTHRALANLESFLTKRGITMEDFA